MFRCDNSFMMIEYKSKWFTFDYASFLVRYFSSICLFTTSTLTITIRNIRHDPTSYSSPEGELRQPVRKLAFGCDPSRTKHFI